MASSMVRDADFRPTRAPTSVVKNTSIADSTMAETRLPKMIMTNGPTAVIGRQFVITPICETISSKRGNTSTMEAKAKATRLPIRYPHPARPSVLPMFAL